MLRGEGKPQNCSKAWTSAGRDGSLCLGGGALQIWTAQPVPWNTTQQKLAMEASVPDEVNFHNLVLRNSKYNRDR